MMQQQQMQMQMQYAHLQAYLQRCHLGQRQPIYQQQQSMAVSGPRKEAMAYPTYPQTQVVNWRPATFNVTPQSQPQLQLSHQSFPRQAHGATYPTTMDTKTSPLEHSSLNQPVYGYAGVHAHGGVLPTEMTGIHHPRHDLFLPSSHFDDNFNSHRPEEATLYNSHHGQQYQQHQVPSTMADFHLHHPAPKPLNDRAAAKVLAQHVTTSPHIPPLQTVQTNVDLSHYEPVSPEEFKSASFDIFENDDAADSSTSIDTHGPFTPGASDYSSSYATSCSNSFGSSFSGGLPDLGSSYGSQDSAMFQINHNHHGLVGSHAGAFDGRSQGNAIDHYCGAGISLLEGGLAKLERHRMPDQLPSSRARATASLRDVDGYPFPVASSQTSRLPRRSATVATVREDSYYQSEDEADRASEQRHRQDQYLLDMREKGLSYRDIKRRGKFKEAESTLRGRVRVLTKAKSERVRKPEWTGQDIRLLRRAVVHFQRKMAYGGRPRSRNGKLPWKRVSDYMKKNGASYLFAPATCAKKWEEVTGEDVVEEDDE